MTPVPEKDKGVRELDERKYDMTRMVLPVCLRCGDSVTVLRVPVRRTGGYVQMYHCARCKVFYEVPMWETVDAWMARHVRQLRQRRQEVGG